ncbi:glycosyltransferase family 2 protein [candidate division WWE3 bacterium]|uniref:Glycosyltransferase family 2 protein n=1 Tax=candidate division WWE3 bacterium TaxID=2053526 RepID=A0A7X9DL37_UNCKA|nr:glycosyltransferase family 2 protein [candidate division WWE3 bacterium]
MTDTGKKLISIVSPAYNEEVNIPLMIEEIKQVFAQKLPKYDFEYILVDDGSSDRTWQVIQEQSKDARIKGIRLSRNFGHQIAMTAGLDQAVGEAVIYCDSDLQHPPEIFSELVEKWEQGFDVVHTVRISTEDIGFVKKFFSDAFYKIINAFSDVRIEKGMADFKLLDKKVLSHLKKFREVNRFLRGIVPWLGFKATQIEYIARKRIHGRAGFSFRKSLVLAKTGILTFSLKPLKFIGYFGILLTITSAGLTLFSVSWFVIYYSWYFSPMVTLTLFNAFLIGIVLICLGIMSLYLSYIYSEVVNRPLYIVSESTNV